MEELLKVAKIFSDKNRVRILALIQRDKEVCVCEICDTLNLSQPLVSRHLRQMREADLLEVQKEGKWMLYSLKHNPYSQCLLEHLGSITLPETVTCNTRQTTQHR